MPLVSIITPLYNKGAYVAETIRSVLAQTVSDWEMIIVNNGSTDDGPNRVRRFSDSRICLVDSVRRGPGAARNVGINLTAGKWLLFLDADDLLEKTYLEGRLIAGSVDAFAKVVAGPWQEFHDTEPSRRALRYPAAWKQDTKRLEAAAFAYAPWALHAAIVRRSHVFPSRLWNEKLDALPSEDCGFWYPIIYDAPVIWSEDNGALYRKHGCNTRDEIVKDLELGFRACFGAIAANEEFLAKMGKQPSPEQAATVVRVLRRMWMRAIRENLAIVGAVGSEIRRWLKKTSYRDLRMVACRLLFAELRQAPKAQAATRLTIRKGIKFFPLLGMPFERCYRAITGRSSVAFEIRRSLNRLPDDAIVLQIGSNDGVSGDPLHELIVHHRKWRCVFVEPVPSVFANLKANYGIDSRFSFVRSAVNHGETAKFYYVDARVRQDIPHLPVFVEQFGSLNREHIVGYSNGILEPYIRELEVPGISFQDLLAQQNLTDIHILHIDAEGYDWEILRQLDLEKIKPRLILFEHHHLSHADRVSSEQFLKPYYDITCHGGDFLCTLRPRWQS